MLHVADLLVNMVVRIAALLVALKDHMLCRRNSKLAEHLVHLSQHCSRKCSALLNVHRLAALHVLPC